MTIKMGNATKVSSKKRPTEAYQNSTYTELVHTSDITNRVLFPDLKGPDSIKESNKNKVLSSAADDRPPAASQSIGSGHDDLTLKLIGGGVSGLVFFLLGIGILLPIAWKLLKKKRYARRYNSVPVELERTLMCAAHNIDPNFKHDDGFSSLPPNRNVRLSLESYEGCSGDDHFRNEYFINEFHDHDKFPEENENSKPAIPQPFPDSKPPDPSAVADTHWEDVSDMIHRYIKQFHTMKLQYKTETNFTCNNFAIGSFDSGGGLLELSHLDVSMFVPPGALPVEKKQDLFMYVSWDNADLPIRDPSKVPASPVIWCGQHGANFKSHVVLSFPQSMQDHSGNCKYRVMRSDTDIARPANWIDVTQSNDTCVIPTKERCMLLVNHFTGYSVVAESGPQTVKKLQVGVFGETLKADDELYQLKVRVWADGSENPKHQLENVLDDIRSLETVNNGEPLCVNVSKVSQGWELDHRYEEISFVHFWPAYSESVTFMAERLTPDPSSFFTVIDVYQKNMNSPASKRKFRPLIKSQDPKPDVNANKETDNGKAKEKEKEVNGNKRLSADEVFLKVEMRLKPTERLCDQLKADTAQKLSVLLDPRNPTGNDWRLLAELSGLSYENIRWIEQCTPSPTLTILHVMAAIHKSELSSVLKTHFKEMKHDTCLELVETCERESQAQKQAEQRLSHLKLDLDIDDDDETLRKESASEESGYNSPSSSRASSRALSAEVNFDGDEAGMSPTYEKLGFCQQSGVPPSSEKSKKGYMV